MSSLRDHIERVMRRPPRGIEPEFYKEAPEPPAPVENSGIGRARYHAGTDPFVGPITACRDCGAMIYDTRAHEGWHQGRAA